MFLARKGVALASFFQVTLTCSLEHRVHYEFPHGCRLAAEWAFAGPSTITPDALQAGFTEPVFAEKHHRLLENFPAYGAGQVIFVDRALGGHCVFWAYSIDGEVHIGLLCSTHSSWGLSLFVLCMSTLTYNLALDLVVTRHTPAYSVDLQKAIIQTSGV